MDYFEWSLSAEPKEMFKLLHVEGVPSSDIGGFFSDRKFRLFICACCRMLPSMEEMHVVDLAEKYADGLIGYGPLVREHFYTTSGGIWTVGARNGYWAACNMLGDNHFRGYDLEIADFLRHIFGNPFHASGLSCPTCLSPNLPCLSPTLQFKGEVQLCSNSWHNTNLTVYVPELVTSLAQRLYNGEDCKFALHDALEQSGDIWLAEHFAEPSRMRDCYSCGGSGELYGNYWAEDGLETCETCHGKGEIINDDDGCHPKGCWALDFLLRKR